MSQKPFHIVVRRSDVKHYRHDSLESAQAEAKRLAKQENDCFFVLSVVDAYKAGPAVKARLEAPIYGLAVKELFFDEVAKWPEEIPLPTSFQKKAMLEMAFKKPIQFNYIQNRLEKTEE